MTRVNKGNFFKKNKDLLLGVLTGAILFILTIPFLFNLISMIFHK